MNILEIIVILFVVYGQIILRIFGSTFANTKAEELHAYLLNATNEDIPPCIGCGYPLQINVTFHLTSLNDLDEVRGEMNSIGFLTVTWVDDRIGWNPYDFAGITSMQMPREKVWAPTLMVGNPSKKISTMNGDIVLVRVLYNGVMIWNPGDVFLTKCYPNIYRYPYDAQECYISVLAWGALASEIMLNCPRADIVVTPHYSDNGEWILSREHSNSEAYIEDGLSIAKFNFRYQRRPQFFVVNVILPIVLLSYLNCLVYILPTESGERVSYSITVLLSFAVFMTLVGDNIPKTSDPMSLLCYYLISIFSGSTLVMVSTIFNTRIFYRDPKIPVSAPYRLMVRLTTTAPKSQHKVKPATGAKADAVTLINVINQNPAKTDKCQRDSLDGRLAKEVKRMKEKDRLENDITWKDVTKALDIISLIGFLIFFTGSTVIQLLYISIPSSGTVF